MQERLPQQGEIYIHIPDGGRYRVLHVGVLCATGYEEIGVIDDGARDVVYEQLYNGAYPRGTLWRRSEGDFMAHFRRESF